MQSSNSGQWVGLESRVKTDFLTDEILAAAILELLHLRCNFQTRG